MLSFSMYKLITAVNICYSYVGMSDINIPTLVTPTKHGQSGHLTASADIESGHTTSSILQAAVKFLSEICGPIWGCGSTLSHLYNVENSVVVMKVM
jgi:hypothetical protein